MTPLARLRRLWRDVHLWIGVGLLIALVPLSLSGSILVWHDALDHALYAERYAVSGPEASQPITTYAAAARGAFSGRATLTEIRLPQKAGDPVVAVGRLAGPPGAGGRPRTLNAWIDPPTGRVLASSELARSFTMILHRVHGSLMIPDIGRKVVGWLGWAMFASCATGLWLWWPRRGGLAVALRWRRGSETLFNLHHLIGFWVCLPLAVLSLTGVYISFPETSRAVFGVAQPQTPRPGGPGRFAPPVAQPRLTLEAAVAKAVAFVPPAQVTRIAVPIIGKAPAWKISLKAAGGEPAREIQIIDRTGEIKVAPAGPQGGPDPLSRLMRAVHDGAGMGVIWQTVIFLTGIAPAILAVSGVVMWLRRRGRTET